MQSSAHVKHHVLRAIRVQGDQEKYVCQCLVQSHGDVQHQEEVLEAQVVEEGEDGGEEDASDGVRVLGLAHLQNDAEQVKGHGDHEDVLEVVPVAVTAPDEQEVLVLREVPAVRPIHVRLHKVRVVVEKADGRDQVVADAPHEAGRGSPFVRLDGWATGSCAAGTSPLGLCAFVDEDDKEVVGHGQDQCAPEGTIDQLIVDQEQNGSDWKGGDRLEVIGGVEGCTYARDRCALNRG